MSEHDIAALSLTEQDSTAPPPKPESETKEETKSSKSYSQTFSIWPPSERTRDAVIKRLIETLSKPSVLSKRYGTIPSDESADVARLIEEEAYSHAAAAANAEDDGIEILQLYSREISKRTLETVKARASSDPVAENGASETVTISNEETSSVDTS